MCRHCRADYDSIGHDQHYTPPEHGPEIEALHDEHESLKRRIKLLDRQLRELYRRLDQGYPPDFTEVPVPEKEKPYRQPGVSW